MNVAMIINRVVIFLLEQLTVNAFATTFEKKVAKNKEANQGESKWNKTKWRQIPKPTKISRVVIVRLVRETTTRTVDDPNDEMIATQRQLSKSTH